MIINHNAPHFVLVAVKHIHAELPGMIGDDTWQEIRRDVEQYITNLETNPNDKLSSRQLYELLANYEPIRQRLGEEMQIQEVLSNNIAQQVRRNAEELGIDTAIAEGLIAAAYNNLHWAVDSNTVPESGEDLNHRGITMGEGGIDGGAKSTLRFKRFQLDLGSFSSIAAGFIYTTTGVIMAPQAPQVLPLLVVGVVLSLIGELHDSLKIGLSEQEASVFWGMIQATGSMHGAGLFVDTIATTTNHEREKFGLTFLNDKQIQHSLSKLKRIGSITQDGEAYRIIEKYTIKD